MGRLFRGKIVLCVTNEIIEEYLEILSQKTTPIIASNIVSILLSQKNVEFVTPYYKLHLIQADEDDNKFVDCAIVSNAIFIVTEDKHFKELENIPFPKVEVVGIDDFLKYLKK